MGSNVSVLLGCLSALSALLALWQWIVAWRFPVHRRRSTPATAPGITVLKPVIGCDPTTEACLRSWFEQDYPGPRQVLIGVASLEDAVVPLVRRLITEYPHSNGQLVHCGQPLGANAKVSTLIQLHAHAAHGFLCVSDADVWAPTDFLSQAVGEFENPSVGLVNSFYQVTDACGLGPRWEALAINADFWSQVLQSASLSPPDFALGAAMVIRRDQLERSGGFRPFADQLADDFHLGNRLVKLGLTIQLSPVVVECRSTPVGFRATWLHQLRWARTIRTCRAWPYFFSILGNATVWPVLWSATTFASGRPIAGPTSDFAILAVVSALLALRALQATLLSWRLTRRWDWSSLWMAWCKDALQLAIWGVAFVGNTVCWRGVRYRVDRAGKLTRLNEPGSGELSLLSD